MFTINTFSISKLNNAEFTGFMINLQKAITTNDPTKLGLIEVLPNFGTTLQKLIDQVYTTTGSEYTAAMLETDLKRDQTYKRIRLRLQMVEVAEDSPAIKAVKDVVKTHLLAKYTSKVPQLPYQEESAILQGFLFNDILTNLERVSDHCSNIAVAMINLSQGNFETHEYLDHLKEKETEAFRKEVNAYAEKYKI